MALFIGIGTFSLLVYLRLRDKIPRDITQPINNFQCLIYISIIFINLFILIYLFYRQRNHIEQESYLSNVIMRIKNIYDYIIETLCLFYISITTKIPYYNYALVTLLSLIIRINPILISCMIYILIILPKTIVSITFIYDVFMEHRFYYFYKTLWILLIPIILKMIFYILDNVKTQGLNIIHLDLELTTKNAYIIFNDFEFKLLGLKVKKHRLNDMDFEEIVIWFLFI